MLIKDKLECFKNELESNTAIQEVRLDCFADIHLSIKREDQNHQIVQGNKWHKLKLNLASFVAGDYKCIVSFGGAFSNHIYATAGLCHLLDIPCIIYVRGYRLDPDNPTLNKLRQWNTKIHLLEPGAYREKTSEDFLNGLREKHPGAYIIPEGGSNDSGLQGMLSFAQQLKEGLAELPDYLCIASGTGASAAAFIECFKSTRTQVLVFSSLKGYDFKKTILDDFVIRSTNWSLIDGYHFGGYARVSKELIDYINAFFKASGVPLDPVYTGKMLYGIEDLVRKQQIAKGSKVLMIHSGGLQGIAAHNYLNGAKKGRLLTE